MTVIDHTIVCDVSNVQVTNKLETVFIFNTIALVVI